LALASVSSSLNPLRLQGLFDYIDYDIGYNFEFRTSIFIGCIWGSTISSSSEVKWIDIFNYGTFSLAIIDGSAVWVFANSS
jgi:hypothetical protein